ncbi:MAG: rod shape-determining protein MreC [Desulfobacterales bacterium]|nr:rod shape-determining protein MreC [Desulfobacterales bacterium]
MFSKKTVLILAGILLVTVNIIFLAIATKRPPAWGIGRLLLAFVAPFQEATSRAVRASQQVWEDYFRLVAIAQENERLRRELEAAAERSHRQQEIELENERLRELLGFKQSLVQPAAAARIVAKDPSSWFNTVIINKGAADGLTKGLPAVTSRGIAGQIVEVSLHQSKLMLIIDPNSAVDALIQRNRVRGIVKGSFQEECILAFVMPEDDVRPGDTVISSGFDGIFPKGLPVGQVSAVSGQGVDFFKEVRVRPAVDFDKLEEVLIILAPRTLLPAGPR